MTNFDDLLSLSYEEMNCGQVVAEGLRRLGMERAAELIPTDQESAMRLLQTVEAGADEWVLLGREACCATKPGDVIAFRISDGWHVSVVTDRQYVLTSARKRGPHRVRRGRLLGVTGVYRWGGAA